MKVFTNISNLVIKTSRLIDFEGIDIDANEMMQNAIQNIQNNLYMSYTYGSSVVNEYNNNDLIASMFPNHFLYGIGVPEINNRSIKITLQTNVCYLLNLDDKIHEFGKHHLFPFFMFNIIQR